MTYRLPFVVRSLFVEPGLQGVGFCGCGARASLHDSIWNLLVQGSNCVPCIGRWILCHLTQQGSP